MRNDAVDAEIDPGRVALAKLGDHPRLPADLPRNFGERRECLLGDTGESQPDGARLDRVETHHGAAQVHETRVVVDGHLGGDLAPLLTIQRNRHRHETFEIADGYGELDGVQPVRRGAGQARLERGRTARRGGKGGDVCAMGDQTGHRLELLAAAQ